MHAPTARLLLIAPLALALAGCGLVEEDEPTVEFPAFSGKRVVFVADADGSSALAAGDEVWVADTGSISLEVTKITTDIAAGGYADLPGAAGPTGPLSYRIVVDSTDGCPSEMRLLPRVGGVTKVVGSSTICWSAWDNIGTTGRFVMLGEVSTGGGPALFVLDSTDTQTIYQVDTEVGPAASTVSHFGLNTNGSSAVWVEATGMYTTPPIAPNAPIGTLVSADIAGELFPTPDSLSVVYAPVGEERYKIAELDGGGSTYLTNALAGADALDHSTGAATLSPDGTRLLYAVTIGGQKQLWSVALAAPLSEARVDSAASLLLPSGHSAKWAPNSAGYAWTGNAGAGNAVFHATVAAPATINTLTPGTEEPEGAILWTDNVTVVYLSSDLDTALPIGANALRSVNVGQPLLTIVMGFDETIGYFHDGVTTCADGTLVYGVSAVFGANIHSAVFTASPTANLSATQISPQIISTQDEIGAISCVD